MDLFYYLIAILNKQLTAPRFIKLNKYTVVCNMSFNVHLFYFPDFKPTWRQESVMFLKV